jgi:hypothetical protein
VDNVAVGHGFSPGFPLSVSINQCSILIFIYTLLLQEEQTAQPGDIKKAMLFWKLLSTSILQSLKIQGIAYCGL